MKKCLACGATYNSHPGCSACGWVPLQKDGVVTYAPEFAANSTGFKQEHFAGLARVEDRNFWFVSRNRLIIWALSVHCPGFSSFLEIGCGTGFVLSGIADTYPGRQFYGSELFVTGIGYAAARRPDASFMQMDARKIPYHNEFDCIGAFDVLEHIEEDRQVLSQIFDALRPGGIMLITVPQHTWLWSHADTAACHVRRYSADEITGKVAAAGFEILKNTSFVSVLLPAMFLSRLMKKRKTIDKYDMMAELEIPLWLNHLFGKLMAIDLFLIKSGFNLPWGGSRLIVAKKNEHSLQ